MVLCFAYGTVVQNWDIIGRRVSPLTLKISDLEDNEQQYQSGDVARPGNIACAIMSATTDTESFDTHVCLIYVCDHRELQHSFWPAKLPMLCVDRSGGELAQFERRLGPI